MQGDFKISAAEFFIMRAGLVFSLTLLPMLAHSIIGCCWHHNHSRTHLDHACLRSATESHAGQNSNDCHQHIETHRCRRTGTSPLTSTPCEQDRKCDEVGCVYMADQPVRVTFAFELNEHVELFDLVDNNLLSVLSRTPPNSHHTRRVSAALQQCALTQVWIV